jgi:hypothetical protein
LNHFAGPVISIFLTTGEIKVPKLYVRRMWSHNLFKLEMPEVVHLCAEEK